MFHKWSFPEKMKKNGGAKCFRKGRLKGSYYNIVLKFYNKIFYFIGHLPLF